LGLEYFISLENFTWEEVIVRFMGFEEHLEEEKVLELGEEDVFIKKPPVGGFFVGNIYEI
jgi:hypothetical protein